MISEVAQTTSSCMMCGLIWYVQLAQYPSLRMIEESRFREAHGFHSTRIAWIVVPVMLTELVTSIRLVMRPSMFPESWTWSLFAMTVVLWLSTICIQIPLHNRLGRGKDLATIDRLVATNWIRTALWTAKSACLGVLLYQGLLAFD